MTCHSAAAFSVRPTSSQYDALIHSSRANSSSIYGGGLAAAAAFFFEWLINNSAELRLCHNEWLPRFSAPSAKCCKDAALRYVAQPAFGTKERIRTMPCSASSIFRGVYSALAAIRTLYVFYIVDYAEQTLKRRIRFYCSPFPLFFFSLAITRYLLMPWITSCSSRPAAGSVHATGREARHRSRRPTGRSASIGRSMQTVRRR